MDRFVLTDAQWAKMELPCLGKKTDHGRSRMDNHILIETVLWITRNGSPWRDLPTISDTGTRLARATATG
ncbi:transposase [Komagataeibacter swingsii]